MNIPTPEQLEWHYPCQRIGCQNVGVVVPTMYMVSPVYMSFDILIAQIFLPFCWSCVQDDPDARDPMSLAEGALFGHIKAEAFERFRYTPAESAHKLQMVWLPIDKKPHYGTNPTPQQGDRYEPRRNPDWDEDKRS